jgi:hypothetical protein
MTAEPMNPIAGPAGPGSFSKRTDLLPSAYYGEGQETQDIKAAATEAKTRGIADRPVKAAPITELFAPTERPDEPVTSGISRGEGPGPEVLGFRAPQPESLSQILSKMLPFDTNGEIAALYEQAVTRGL